MKKNRVDCVYCDNFISPKWKNPENLMSITTNNAKCKLGKRVMFRQPKDFYDGGGWIRYCNEFNDKINEK